MVSREKTGKLFIPCLVGKGLICDTKTDSLATRNHPPFYLRSDTKSDSFATHTPLGSIGGTGDRGQGLGGTGVRGDKGLS